MKDWQLVAKMIRERIDASSGFTPPVGGWEEVSKRLEQQGPPMSASRLRDVMDETYAAGSAAAAWTSIQSRLDEHYNPVPNSDWKKPLRWVLGIAGTAACIAVFSLWNQADLNPQPNDNKGSLLQDESPKITTPSKSEIPKVNNQPSNTMVNTPSRPMESNTAGLTFPSKNKEKESKSIDSHPNIFEADEKISEISTPNDADITSLNAISQSSGIPIDINLTELNKQHKRSRAFNYIRIPDFIERQPLHSVILKIKGQVWQNWENSQTNFTPSVGLQYRYMPGNILGLESGVELSFQNGMDVKHEISQVKYGLSKVERIFTLEPQTAVFIDVPLRMYFQASARNSWSLGARMQYLLDTKATLTEFDKNDSILKERSSITQFGYTQGFNSFNFALELNYSLKISETLSISSEIIWGMTDLTDNTFFNSNRKDFNRGININLLYTFFSVD